MSGEHKDDAGGAKSKKFAARSSVDRRTGDDRRDVHDLEYFESDGHERRSGKERRVLPEKRTGWVRVSRWHSICVNGSPCSPPKVP
jgi:hypothetical protein